MWMRLCQRVSLLVVSTFLIAGLARAQVRTTGQLSGTVVDASGAALSATTITARDASTGLSKSVTANAAGQYIFPDLQPGSYQVTATVQGFSAAVYDDVVIESGRTRDLAIQMKVGTATERVEVSAQGLALETTTNTLSTTIDPEQVQDLPLAGRDILPMAELVAGAQSGGDERFTTYDSLPNGSISITIDGMTANSMRYRTSTTGFFTFAPLRLGAFDEATVSTSELTADAGAEGSTQVRFVTKRGTNQFHGNAFWQAINSYFDANTYANNALGIPKPLEVLNDWGGSVGGPLWKNKVFFFVNFEGLTQKFPYPTTTEYPTTQAQQGLFTYVENNGTTNTVNLLNIAANGDFPSTINPQIAPLLSAINGYAANGAVSPVSGLPYEQSVSYTAIQPDKEFFPTTRLDYQITPKVDFHSSWDVWWRNLHNYSQTYPGATPQAGGFKSTYYVFSNGLDWTISPHLINQASFGIEGDVELFNPGNGFGYFQNQGNLVISPAYLANGGPQVFTPVIPGFVLPLPRDNPVWTLWDNLTWTRGKHTFTFGGDLRISNSHELEINNPPAVNLGLSALDPAVNGPTNIFTTGPTGNFPNINTQADLPNAEALYSALVGRINYISGSSWVNTSTHQYQIEGQGVNKEAQTVGGIYFQDSWRMTPHFALNYGLRWQFTGAVHNTNGLWTSPTMADLLGPSTGLFQPGVLSSDLNPQIDLRPNPYSNDFKEPAPNFGFAWNPRGGDTVVRGGFSLSRYDEGWLPVEGATLFGNPGGEQAEFLYPGSSGLPGAVLGNPLTLNTSPASFTFPQPESAFFESGLPLSTIDPNIRPPYVEAWNFGVQQKLPGNVIFEISYVGNHAVHMWMSSDLNETNIFENGFLTQFESAQQNLAACVANPTCNAAGPSFQNQGLSGQVPLPIFDAAFGVPGASAPGFSTQTGSYTNSSYVAFLQQGQAGALANQLATQAGGTFLCNMVGTSLSPCAGLGLTGPGKYPINFFQANPFAAGTYAQVLSDPGSSSYNGLQVQAKHQTRHGLTINANYTWSHSFTNRFLGDYYTADSASVNFITLRDRKLNRAPGPYDLRSVFRTFFTYELPFGKGHYWNTSSSALNRVIGGWTVGSIVTAQSGRNFKLQSGYNTFNYSNATWPDASDSGVVLNGITRSQLQSKIGVYPGPNPSEPTVFFPSSLLTPNGNANPSLLAPPTTPGQLGQFITLTGPLLFNTDISIVKSIPITERIKFNIWAEFLNAFNHTDWNVLDNFSYKSVNNPADYANITSSTFPALTEANTPRNIEFRLQLAF